MTKCFVAITNEDIFKKITDIENKLDKDVAIRLLKMEKRISIAVWTSSTALTICLLMIARLITL